MVALDVTLISAEQMLMRNRGESESILKDAINALGPKQRRQYKGSSIQNIVESLLPPQKAVVVLSNLAVNPSFRRNGVALRLCNEVERIAKEDWGFDELYLRVESSNVAARALYETQLSYRLAWVEKNAVALRADLKSGNFVECASDTLILVKSL
jgi:ribosomal protein S18 acetylase RimI-like enzyme